MYKSHRLHAKDQKPVRLQAATLSALQPASAIHYNLVISTEVRAFADAAERPAASFVVALAFAFLVSIPEGNLLLRLCRCLPSLELGLSSSPAAPYNPHMEPTQQHHEHHAGSGAVIRDMVIGLADGLTVPFALAAGHS